MAVTITWVAAASEGGRHYARIAGPIEEEADLAFDGAYPGGAGETADVSARFASVISIRHVPGNAGNKGWPFVTAANPNNIVAVVHDGGTAAAGKFALIITTTGAAVGAVSAAGLTALRVCIKGLPLLTYAP